MGGPCSKYLIDEKSIGGSVGKYEEKKQLGRPRRKWANNIEICFKEIGWGVDWIDLGPKRDRRCAAVNAVMNLRVP